MLLCKGVVMTKKINLAAALQNATGKADASQPASEVKPVMIKKDSVAVPPSRQGKKAITGFFDPAVSRQLKQLALDDDKTIQILLAEALNDLFVKYNQKPIA
jgi:shikimate kinase